MPLPSEFIYAYLECDGMQRSDIDKWRLGLWCHSIWGPMTEAMYADDLMEKWDEAS